MNRVSGFCCVALSALVLAACGGGGGGGSGGGGGPGTGSPTLDDAARRAVLSDLGTLLILPGLETLSDQATDLSSAVAALASAPGNATARSAAQDAWSSAMVAVQRAEVLQVGPAARSSEPGGMDLRDQIYAYPQINLCAIHTAAYSDSQVTASSPINTTGMGALEYLLFSDADNANCLPGAGIDAQAKRAEHASRIADRIAQVAAELLAEWEASGDNFINEFSNAGNGGSTFSTPQMALNAVSTAIFYAEKETKDRKIANPTGVGATGLPACPTVSCPQRVESLYAQTSGAHIVANLQVFRDVFTGVSGGLGLNDLLDGIGREDLSAQIVTQLNAAINAAVALEDSFEAEVAAIPSEQACANAVSSRSGDPAACALLGLVDAVTDTLRAEVTSALNLTIPNSAAGDND